MSNTDMPRLLRLKQITALSVIYKERDVGRTLTKEEFHESSAERGKIFFSLHYGKIFNP